MTWNRRHLLDLQTSLRRGDRPPFSTPPVEFKAVGRTVHQEACRPLRGKTVVNLFVEPSTRTRISFELAAMRLSADVINFSAEASSLKKGETLQDTARNLEALNADIIILRHGASGAPHFLSRFLRGPMCINAGDGAHEHPTQGLLDVVHHPRAARARLAGLNVTILGDILYSRVARSNIWALTEARRQGHPLWAAHAWCPRPSSRRSGCAGDLEPGGGAARRRRGRICCASSTSASG
jgi:aspartate carbamoyltransferase catalytic subunit